MSKNQDIAKDQFGEFKTPEGYFEALKDEIKLKQQLSEHDKQSFKVPENYFEELRANIARNKEETRVIPFWKHPSFRIAVVSAAAVALLFFILGNPWEEQCESFACLMEQTELQPEDLGWMDDEIITEVYLESIDGSISEELNEDYIDYLVEEDIYLDEILEE